MYSYIYIHTCIENKTGLDHIHLLSGTRCMLLHHNGFAQMFDTYLVEKPGGYMVGTKHVASIGTSLGFCPLLGLYAGTAFNTTS